MKIALFTSIILLSIIQASLPERAQEWVLQNTDGKNIALTDLYGNVVIIDFWAIWCSTCKPELRELSALQDELGSQGLQIVGIGVDSGDLEFLKEFKSFMKLSFPLLTGQRRLVKRILRDYGNIRQIPSMIIIDQSGYIIHRITGFKNRSELLPLLIPLLSEEK